MDSCFVCLKPAKKSVCNTCNCVAHDNCWITFYSKSYVPVNFTDVKVNCPQCRSEITENVFSKRLTRSQTKDIRKQHFNFLLLRLNSFIETIDHNDVKFDYMLDNMFKLILKNKEFWINDNLVKNCISTTLKELYEQHNYKTAKEFHWKLLNTAF